MYNAGCISLRSQNRAPQAKFHAESAGYMQLRSCKATLLEETKNLNLKFDMRFKQKLPSAMLILIATNPTVTLSG